MFNFNLNWLKIIKENVPLFDHSIWLFDWLKVLISPFDKISKEFLIAYDLFVLKIRFNGQIIYLEKILNDKFSPTSGGIYIIDGNTNTPNYLYRKIEGKTPIYLYRKWKSTINYVVDNYVVINNKVYKCTVANIGFNPSLNPTKWVYHSDVVFFKRAVDFYIQYDFIVKIPSTLTFNNISLRAIVDYYRLAGKHYKIELY